MENKLMYVGITHETAYVNERAYFAFSELQKKTLITQLKSELPIHAITILSTCNRTEIYFESNSISPFPVLHMLIAIVQKTHRITIEDDLFQTYDNSIDTTNHLLHVANGLKSATVGDKQIITQVKQAYQEAIKQKNQGSLLERAFQAVFRSHKRITNESLYKQGSTSTAYSSLKMVESYFGKEEIKHKSVLIIGAGEIAQDLLMYLPKCQFWNVFIANRTAEKANKLAYKYQVNTYDWKYVKSNDFTSFDVVITAVSNQKYLVNQVENCDKKRLWIDLAMPCNINPLIKDAFNIVYNVDQVTTQIRSINDLQKKAIPKVEAIIADELTIFSDWLKQDEFRTILRRYKHQVKQKILKKFSIPLT
ncbi:MAG: glutamyl-tRNA reductase, partial [Bacteroidota bacterium]